MNARQDPNGKGAILPYRLTLALNCFSLAAFLVVIGIGLGFHSWPVTVIGIVLSAMFVVNCILIIRTGKERWGSRRRNYHS